jgi:replicative DNA helicase
MTPSASKGNFLSASDALARWREDLYSGKVPEFYRVGVGELEKIEIGPGQVALFGGAPGAGKTAFTMQLVFDALRHSNHLRAVVCNIEMSVSSLLERQLARLSGIDLTVIRRRRLGEEHTERLEMAMATIDSVSDRLAFVRSPFSLDNVALTVDEFEADLIVLDYLQRIRPPEQHADNRRSIDATMNYLRAFADAGMAVLVVAAVARSKDSKGRSSYSEGLNLASFRESSELEFGADDAYMLIPEPDRDSGIVHLQHLKSRHGEPCDIALEFDRRCQRFTATSPPTAQKEERNSLQPELKNLWERHANKKGDETS